MESPDGPEETQSQNEAVTGHDAEAEDDHGRDDTSEPLEFALGTGKSKRSGKKSVADRGPTALPKFRGTGFEEYFADPPMTPQEAEDEKYDIYAPSLSFEERIQSCIQRFKGRRRMNNDLQAYFDQYLFFGGIDTSPNAYVGLDPVAMKDLTPAERRGASTTTVVHTTGSADSKYYNGDAAHWTVDFTGVVAGFLSSNTLLTQTQHDEGKLSNAVGVVEHFLRYVLQHDVCPEYEADVKRAMQLCQTARAEYPLWMRLEAALPGQFNMAAHAIFRKKESKDLSGYEVPEADLPRDVDPQVTFYSAVALMADEENAKYFDRTPVVIGEYSCTIEVRQVHRPDAEVTELFENLTLDGVEAKVPTIGRVVGAVVPRIEDEWDYPEVEPALPLGSEIALYFDDSVLQNMIAGMKLELKLCELDVGLRYVKEVVNTAPSFQVFLPQELMKGFREPVENDRPGPSVENPETGEWEMVRE